MGLLDDDERARLVPAESFMFASPVPTRPVSSDEFVPGPQSARQRELEPRIKRYGAELAARQGLRRRRFLRTAAGMAAAFVALNETYAPVYAASAAEAANPDLANERACRFAAQPVIDVHTHFPARRHAPEQLRAGGSSTVQAPSAVGVSRQRSPCGWPATVRGPLARCVDQSSCEETNTQETTRWSGSPGFGTGPGTGVASGNGKSCRHSHHNP